jgi:16S rRNA (uracil1498-N3)-methyltransferase
MRLTRVYVDAELDSGRQLTVTGSAGNHIARVLRLRTGDSLTLFNGQGGEYGASIGEIRRDTVLVTVLEHRETERESPFQLVLTQGISRGERMDWVVQKATELGVTRIVPIFTERSVVQLDARQAERKVQHWLSIAIAACEQSGRNRVPQIDLPVGLYEMLEKRTAEARHATARQPAARVTEPQVTPPALEPQVSAAGAEPRAAARTAEPQAFASAAEPQSTAPVGEPRAAAPALAVLLSPTAALRLAELPAEATGASVLIGPEGGLTDVEQEAALRSGYTAVRLGPRVLRTETAAVCALTLLQQRFGDL